MTFGEMHELTENSKHKTIGCVTLYMNLDTRKCDLVRVKYKLGRVFQFRGKAPQTVKEFLKRQNCFTSYISRDVSAGTRRQVVTYFMK